jgi:hypothetical protein
MERRQIREQPLREVAFDIEMVQKRIKAAK